MDPSSRAQARYQNLLKGLINFVNFFCIIGMIMLLFHNWYTLNSCSHREMVALIVALIYWLFRGENYSSYFSEMFQVFIIFVLVQKLNINEAAVHKECLQPETILGKCIYVIYVVFFSYYMSVVSVFCIIVILFAISEMRNTALSRAFRHRNMNIRGREFEALERIKFSASETPQSDSQAMCSICLADFEEQEEIIKLPVCNHYFHKPCLKQWLEMHSQCPYCRSNIRTNLKRMRRQARPAGRQSQSQNRNELSTVNLNIEEANQPNDFELDRPVEANENRRESSQAYIEMVET